MMVRTMRWAASVSVAVAVSLAGGCSGDAAPEDERETSVEQSEPAAQSVDQVAQLVEERLHSFDGIATGAIVLVRVGDQTRTLVSGRADIKQRRRMSPDDRFAIQSITKTMVATTLLQQVAAGRISLNDSVEDVVPGLLPQGERITMRHLLSHRAGLHEPGGEDLPPPSRMTDESLVDATVAHPLDFAPGTQGSYSNVGYEVIARVVERVTGTSLAEAMADNVFEPAGMSDTALLGSTTVQGYFDSKPVSDPYLPFVPASGGVVSTVGDIDRFYTALWNGDLLDKQLVDTMTEPLGVVGPWGMEYGLGVWLNIESCGDAMGHSGQGPGFSTKAWTIPDNGRSVVVMVNDGDGASIADSLATTALCE